MSGSLICKRRMGRLFACIPRHRADSRGEILIYHSVGGGPMSTFGDAFEKQMAWLAKHAEVVSLDDIVSEVHSTVPGKLRVALTFDDGYRTLHDVVAPLLSRYGFSATVYLNIAHIGDNVHEKSDPGQGHYPKEQFMIWSEIESLKAQHWTIGSHGLRHLDLTKQPETVVVEQLTGSKGEIESRFGETCGHFSYTWGRHNSMVRKCVAEAGYASAVAGHHAPLSKKDDLLALPRLDIRQEYELEDFIAVLRGDWDYLEFIQKISGSSAESVGDHRFRQISKCMI